jgi:bacterioferritin (cytochrome b1)
VEHYNKALRNILGKTLKEMIQRDVKDEENTISLYKEIISQVRMEKD